MSSQTLQAKSSSMLWPALASLAIAIALAAQGYMTRRVFLSDVAFLLVCAVGLFVAAFWGEHAQRSRGWLAAFVKVLLVGAAVVIAARVYTDLAQGRNFVVAVALAFLPPLLVGAAFAGSRHFSLPDDAPDSLGGQVWERLRATPLQRTLDWLCAASGGALAVVAVVYWFKPNKSNEAIVVNILSLAFLFLAIYRMDRGKPAALAARTDAPPLPVELAAFLVILTVGAFLRLWQLNLLPLGVWFDEAQAGQEALRFMQGIPFTPMGTYTSNNPSLFFYVVALLFKITGPTLLSLRVVQALIGLLTIPAFYLLLRYMFGWRTALIGALVLAASAWHVDFSRFGMCCNIEAPPFEILTLLFLLKGLHSNRLADFAWGGLMMGLGQFTYAAFRLFPIIIGVYVIYALILNKDRVRQSIPGLIVYAVVAIVAFAPLGTWAWQNRQDFMARTAQTSVFAGKNTAAERMSALTNSLRRHILMFNYQGDGNGRHNLPGSPALDSVTGALFVIGLAYCVYRWRSPGYLLILLWFGVMMMSGIMSLDWEAPQMARTVVAIPAICAIAAVAAGKVWAAWDKAISSLPSALARNAGKLLLAGAVAALLSVITYVNFDKYFNRQMKNSEVYYAYSTVETVVARRVAELGPTANRYFIQDQGGPSFAFVAGGDSPQRPVDDVFFQPYAHMPLREPMTKTAVFMLEPWRVTIDPADVLRYYPHAKFQEIKDPFGTTMVYEFQVPPDDVNNLMGLTAAYYAGDAPTGTPLLQRVDRTIAFDWHTQSPVPGPFNVEWTGSIVPPTAGTYTLDVVSDGMVRVTLDGQALDLGPNKTQVQLELAKGLHPVDIQFRGASISLNWILPGGQRQTIPGNALIALGWPDHGLVGRYYRGDAWQGLPQFVQVDPFMAFRWHPDPIEGYPGGWSATWTGKFDAPTAGKYLFQGVTNDRLWLIIDGKTYMEGIRSMNEVQVDLAAGKHDIQIKYANNRGYSEMRMMWRKPNGTFEPLPRSVLYVK